MSNVGYTENGVKHSERGNVWKKGRCDQRNDLRQFGPTRLGVRRYENHKRQYLSETNQYFAKQRSKGSLKRLYSGGLPKRLVG